MTLGDVESIFINQLPSFYEKDEAKAVAALAVEHVCHITRSYYMLHKSEPISLPEETSLIRILDELRFGRPLQYVLEEADFFGMRFKVNPSVLIPRQETEELVNWIITYVKELAVQMPETYTFSILDIGTGSGCIPVVLKKNLPDAVVCALDISEEALETAQRNAVLNETDVKFIKGDILDSLCSAGDCAFRIIVSNPPYITPGEKKLMHSNVLDFEPATALFVPEDDPLLFYRHIAAFSQKYLDPQGSLFLEINEMFGLQTCELLEQQGFSTELRKDLRGKDRMIRAWR